MSWASLVAQLVKNLPAVQETLGLEDPLEKGMATHSSILAWKIPWTEKPGRLLSMGLQRVRHDRVPSTCILLCINPLMILWDIQCIFYCMYFTDKF